MTVEKIIQLGIQSSYVVGYEFWWFLWVQYLIIYHILSCQVV